MALRPRETVIPSKTSATSTNKVMTKCGCRGLFSPSGAFFRLQFSADYIISMSGFDFRPPQRVAQAHFPRTKHMALCKVYFFFSGHLISVR